MALAPQTTYLKTRLGGEDALLVSTFETSSVTTALGGQSVTVEQRSEFPRRGESRLAVRLSKPTRLPCRCACRRGRPRWA